MEYIFTNLPQYVKVNSRTEFSSSVVSSGAVLLFSEDGLTLTGKLPDGTFITIGGSSGTEPVGDATSGDILAGKSATVSGGSVISGTIPTVSATSAGSQINVPAGYIPTSQTFNVSGGVDVSDTTAQAADVLSGKVFYNSGGIQTSGTIPTVSATLAANVTTVPAGYIASAQELTVPLASSATVAGGIVTIPAGYVASAYTVSAGGSSAAENVSSGAYISEGETVAVSSGWEYTYANVIHGSLTVLNGGAAVNAMTADLGWDPGYIHVSSGGIARTAIVSGGSMLVSSGGSADRAVLLSGNMIIYNGGNAGNIVQMGGKIAVSEGLITNTDILGGSAVVSSGGTANVAYVRQGGRMDVFGQAASITVRGVLDVWGSADHVHVCSGGIMYQREGSTITNLVVDEGGEVQ